MVAVRDRPVERVAVMASGAGTTFAALTDGLRGRDGAPEVVLLIVSRAESAARALAGERSVETAVLDQRSIGPDDCDQRMAALLRARQVDLIVLAGYLRKIGPLTLSGWPGRILNTHPGPLPRFGGQGMYGDHVHRAVLASGVRMSAATVQVIDADYDTGPVIAERPVPVRDDDDVTTLGDRVRHAERELLLEAVLSLAEG